ncbi:MAG: polysaccharide pyruvyl transferase family protein [bacterium]
MKILVIGLTSTSIGGMEFHNLGNFIIAEPLFRLLRQTFPDAKINTSIQMSDSFYGKYNIKPLRNKRFWSYGIMTGTLTIFDFIRISLWKITKIRYFLNSSQLLKQITEADLILDFSGDLYGDNAHWRRFLESNARLIFALLMNKKVVMLIGSPGPFNSIWRFWLAKKILPKMNLITNREPVSTKLLKDYGIQGNIHTTACPSVLFEPADTISLKQKKDYNTLF